MSIVKNNPPFTDESIGESALEPELLEEQSAESIESEPAEEVETTDVSEETDSTEENAPVVEQEIVQKIKIGEKEFSNEELEELVTKGSTVKGWEQKMPGFNIDTLMPDYTRKSQRLSEYEKRSAPKESKQNVDELKEMGVDEDQINAFQKVAKHLGFVRQTDLIEDSVEVQKESFIARHPEYAPGTPVSDAKWAKLMEEFSFYNWKQNPNKVEQFLEKSHNDVSKSWLETERGQKVRETITTKQAKVNAAAMGGSGTGKGAPAPVSDQSLAEKYRASGWTEEEIKEILT